MLCHEVAGHLTARGYQIAVLTSTYGMDGYQEEARVYRKLALESDVNYYHPLQNLNYWKDRRNNYRVVRDVLAEERPDLVVVWGMWNLSKLIPWWIEELVGSKVLYYLSDQWPAMPSAHRAYWEGSANSRLGRLFKQVFRHPARLLLYDEWKAPALRFEHVLVCSQAVKDSLIQAGVPVEHATVLYHGIDPTPYQQAATLHHVDSPTGELRVVFVGGLLPHKGVHTAVEALGYLTRQSMPGMASLAVLGAGHPEYEARLNRMVMEEGLGECVTFHRPIPRSELPDFLARFDVLVMPSVYEEPQARISQEAMAAGLVLVATLTGGTKEILVDGVNGLAFAPEDAKGLAEQLRRLIDEPDLGQRLKLAGWRTVSEQFTISRMIDEFEAAARVASNSL